MSCETLSGLIFARIMFCGFGEFFFFLIIRAKYRNISLARNLIYRIYL